MKLANTIITFIHSFYKEDLTDKIMSELKVDDKDLIASITPNTPGTPNKKQQCTIKAEYTPSSPTSILDPQATRKTTSATENNNKWTFNVGTMPTPTSGHTATCIDKNRIVLVGGLNHENQRLKSVDLFSTEDKYTPLFDMSTERSSHGAVYFEHQRIHDDNNDDVHNSEDKIDNKCNSDGQNHKYLYICGGFNINGKSLKSVERMNTKTYWWEKVSDMIQPRSRCATTACKNHIYVLGGYSKKSTYLSSMERYDPADDSWEVMPPMKHKRIYHAAVTVGERIYVLGGGENGSISGILKSVEVFDTAAKSWSRGPDMPMKLSGMSAVAVEKWILVIGGLSGKGEAISQAFVLNTETLKWYTLESPMMNTGRSTHAVAVRQSKIYAFGGQGGTNHSKLHSVEEIMFHDLMKVVLDLHATNVNRMKGFKRPLKLFQSKEAKKEKENDEDAISTAKESHVSQNASFDITAKPIHDNNEQNAEEDNQSSSLSSTNSSKSNSSKSYSKPSPGLGTNVLNKINSFRKKNNYQYQNFEDGFDENLSLFSDQPIDDDGSFCSSIAMSNHTSMLATKKMEENFMSMKCEYVDLEKKVKEQNKSIDQLLKTHRLSEMETLIVEQRKIIQDLVRREHRNTLNDDLLICNGKIAKMEKLSDGHRLIFNNFRRQQQRTNHINSYKIEEIEKAFKEQKDIVEQISLKQNEEDGKKEVNEDGNTLILKLEGSVDNLVEKIERQQVSHNAEIEEMKLQHEERVAKLENTLVAMQKSYDQKFAKILDTVENLELVSECLKKEITVLKIENQFLKDE